MQNKTQYTKSFFFQLISMSAKDHFHCDYGKETAKIQYILSMTTICLTIVGL